MDDQQILLRIRENPDEGLASVIDQYGAVVLTVVRRVLRRNPEDAEECAADAIIKFWETAQKLDPESTSIRAYLICIARNTAINRYHYLKRHEATSLDETFALLPDAMDVDEQVLEKERTEILLETIQSLPEPNREIMIQRYFHYQPIQAIADKLKLSASAVKNRIQYAKKTMNKALTRKGVAI